MNAVRQDAAFEEGVELVFDELRQAGAGSEKRQRRPPRCRSGGAG
jgi:hypothetical protein